MSLAKRRELIKAVEDLRGTRVLCYVTGDRQPTGAQIGDDAVRPMYQLLRTIGNVPKLDLFIYSRGGAIDVPWRMATAFRTAARDWYALIPFRANSAATLLALGADGIVLGRNGELGPIDPILNMRRIVQPPGGAEQGTVVQDSVPVEDVMAYVRFIQERAGLSDQKALTAALTKLTDRLDPVAIGSLYRTHSHIRDVARRMLLSRRKPGTEQTVTTIVDNLAERVYAHGHAIGVKNAKEVGLPAESASPELDSLLWELLGEYESDMKLLDPIDPAVAVANTDRFTEDSMIAVVEAEAEGFELRGTTEIAARRQMPPTLNVSVNLNLQVPPAVPGAQPAEAQQALQQLLQAAQPAILQQAQQAVQDALKAQAPIAGLDTAFRNGKWVKT